MAPALRGLDRDLRLDMQVMETVGRDLLLREAFNEWVYRLAFEETPIIQTMRDRLSRLPGDIRITFIESFNKRPEDWAGRAMSEDLRPLIERRLLGPLGIADDTHKSLEN
jgi:hypothetical protein